VTCAISWGRCSLIGLLVVTFVVVVFVLRLFSFPVEVVGLGGGGGACPLVLFSLLMLSVFGSVGVLSNSAIMKSDLLCSAVTV
jgi:hypothetical protein